jgi:hypothetical protein
MPLFSRQPLSLARSRCRCEVRSDSALPPVLHFLTNFHNRLRQHLAFSNSHCLLLLLPERRFFSFFPKGKKNFRDWNLFLSWRLFGVVLCVISFFL